MSIALSALCAIIKGLWSMDKPIVVKNTQNIENTASGDASKCEVLGYLFRGFVLFDYCCGKVKSKAVILPLITCVVLSITRGVMVSTSPTILAQGVAGIANNTSPCEPNDIACVPKYPLYIMGYYLGDLTATQTLHLWSGFLIGNFGLKSAISVIGALGGSCYRKKFIQGKILSKLYGLEYKHIHKILSSSDDDYSVKIIRATEYSDTLMQSTIDIIYVATAVLVSLLIVLNDDKFPEVGRVTIPVTIGWFLLWSIISSCTWKNNLTATRNSVEANLSQVLVESLEATEEIRLQNYENLHLNQISHIYKELRQIILKSSIAEYAANFVYQHVAAFLGIYLLIDYIGSDSLQRAELDELALLLNYLLFFYGSMANLGVTLTSIVDSVRGISDILKVTNLSSEDSNEYKEGDLEMLHSDPQVPVVEFTDVCYYSDNGDQVLSNVSFKIMPGETVALLGPSGAGKTTVLNIITGLYKPQSGDVRIFGKPIFGGSDGEFIYPIKWARKKIGKLSQKPSIFKHACEAKARLAFNVLYTPADDEDIEANISERRRNVLNSVAPGMHPEDIHTDEDVSSVMNQCLVGACLDQNTPDDEIVRLSGGEKQRVNIARHFRRREILILDEAFSALDPNTRNDVITRMNQSLLSLSNDPGARNVKAILMITHNPSISKECSHIIYLEGGRVMEDGVSTDDRSAHDKLMADNLSYAHHFNSIDAPVTLSFPQATADVENKTDSPAVTI